MTKRFLMLFLALDALLLVTGFAIYQHGLIGFVQNAVVNSANLQILVDLGIAITLFLTWMWRDAKQHGHNPLPWTIAIVFTGSLGALTYLLRRELTGAKTPAVAPA